MRKRIYQYVPSASTPRELDYQLAYNVLHGDLGAWDRLYLAAYTPVMREIKNLIIRDSFQIMTIMILQMKRLQSAMNS